MVFFTWYVLCHRIFSKQALCRIKKESYEYLFWRFFASFLLFLSFIAFFLFFMLFHVMSCHVFYINNLSYTFIICYDYLSLFLSSFFFYQLNHFWSFFQIVMSRHVTSCQNGPKKKKFAKRLGQFFFSTSNRACMQNFMLLAKIPTDFE